MLPFFYTFCQTLVSTLDTDNKNILITDDEEIFKKLHSHFTWMLRTGAATYSETLYTSRDLLKKLTPNTSSIFNENSCSVPKNESMSLRELEKLLSKEVFRILLYCTLTGIDVS